MVQASSQHSLHSEVPKVHLISLGCARNRVDSEVMLGSLLERGWAITDEPAQAAAIVVNTCGFIGPAKEESIQTILDASEYKAERPDMKLIVAGCLAQRYKRQLLKGLPEVDLFIGTDQFSRLPELMEEPPKVDRVIAQRTHYLYNDRLPRVNTLAKHSAYLKVAEGCQHNCAFCIIPAIRGRLRSRPLTSLVTEAKNLAAQGVVELNLIAQDLAAYGRDWEKSSDREGALLRLLKELVKVEGIDWIRLLYMYPENIHDDFLDFFAAQEKLVKYLDIPVQHGSDEVLKRMNRVVSRAELDQVVRKVRERVPGIALRTSVMVGFPGETEQEFEELLDFVRAARFDHLGCFTYSQEEGTAAGRMADQVPEEVKAERMARVMELQQEVSKENLRRHIGKVYPVLLEKEGEPGVWVGRMSLQAPEVDGVVKVTVEGEAGDLRGLAQVRITDAAEYDLAGQLV